MIYLLLALAACTAPRRSTAVLEDQGYTEVSARWWAWAPWGCSDDDWYATRFTATTSVGTEVKGTVCCGFFKNCTVRYSRTH